MKKIFSFLLLCFLFNISGVYSQKYLIRDIKNFGAKGDGKTNDQQAFEAAANFFNVRGGNGTLTISKGIYIVGKQTFTGGQPNKSAYEGEDVLRFINIKNLKIIGSANTILRFKDSLHFGSFSPGTGLPYQHKSGVFRDNHYAAFVGSCIHFYKCTKVSVSNLKMDGNNKGLILGGTWADVGIQLVHYGIFIENSNNVTINNMNVHHFGLDGICVANEARLQKDSINILNSTFEYNSRQGLSWVGGNNLISKNCKFNNTGQAAFSSPPSAGVDIEAEVGPVRNGYFLNCEFINNKGVGMVADAGNDSACTFKNCIFWGIDTYSIWITKPAFTFDGCNIYGSFVHGYNSPDERNATKFISCNFEDKSYNDKEPFGNYLIESNNSKRVSFYYCKFITNKKRLCWISIDPKTLTEEKYQFTNCTFLINNISDSNRVLVGSVRGMALKNCTFDFINPQAKRKKMDFINFKDGVNVDLGGNKILNRD